MKKNEMAVYSSATGQTEMLLVLGVFTKLVKETSRTFAYIFGPTNQLLEVQDGYIYKASTPPSLEVARLMSAIGGTTYTYRNSPRRKLTQSEVDLLLEGRVYQFASFSGETL